MHITKRITGSKDSVKVRRIYILEFLSFVSLKKDFVFVPTSFVVCGLRKKKNFLVCSNFNFLITFLTPVTFFSECTPRDFSLTLYTASCITVCPVTVTKQVIFLLQEKDFGFA